MATTRLPRFPFRSPSSLLRTTSSRHTRFLSVTPRKETGEAPLSNLRLRPRKRENEPDATLRARLLYQSRYRGTLESDLLLSTFAQSHLPSFSRAQMEAYDEFLGEEDWDIYYWATQESGQRQDAAAEAAPAGGAGSQNGDAYKRPPPEGEWARTVGNFKAAYRPVPERWEGSEVLRLLREHVSRRSASSAEGGGGGMARRPDL